MMTGQYLYQLLQQKTGQAYSGYLDTFKSDKIFKEAYIKALELNYKKGLTQSQKDNTTSLTSVNNPVILFAGAYANRLQTQPLQISNVTIGSGTTFIITTVLPNNVPTGTSVTISGVTGTLNMNTANGTFSAFSSSGNTFTIVVASATGVYNAGTGSVITEITIPNYWHLLAIKCRFVQPDYTWSIVSVTGNAVPIIVTLSGYNSYRTGDVVTIGGVLGNYNANGTFYIKKLNSFKIQLFSDANLQVPAIGAAAYTTGGTLSKVYYKYAFPYISEQKISSITVPTPDLPAFEIANNLINIYPQSPICTNATIDYITKPLVQITSTDNVIDLENYYPQDFLFYVLDTAAELFSEQVRDRENVEFQAAEKAQNN